MDRKEIINEEAKPITVRMKPSTHKKVKDVAKNEGVSFGDMIEIMVEKFLKNYDAFANSFMIGCINRLKPISGQRLKCWYYNGTIAYRGNPIVYRRCDKYEKILREKYDLGDLDLTNYVVGSSVTLAQLDVLENYVLHEELYIKDSRDNEIVLSDMWVTDIERDGDPAKAVSPFVDMLDLISILSFFAEESFQGEEYLDDDDYNDDDFYEYIKR